MSFSARPICRRVGLLGIADGRVFADDTCVYVATDMKVSLVAPSE